MRIALTTFFVLAAVAVSGCSFSVGTADQKTKLEEIISTQLPGEAQEAGLGEIEVNDVTCVEKDADRYDCLAKISGTTTEGKPATRSIPIDGSCDAEECVWKTR